MMRPGIVAQRRRNQVVPFSAVELLVNAETAGATADDFLDASSFARTITRNSASTIRSNGAGIPAFGSWGISYAASSRSDWIVGAVADWKFLHDGSTKWTIDMQVDPTNFAGTMTLFDTGGGTTTNAGIYCAINTSRQVVLQIYRASAGTFWLTGTFGTALDNNNNLRHIRIACDPTLGSNNATLYENGSSRGALSKSGSSASASNPAFALRFGGFASAGTDPFRGSMDEVRVSKGYTLAGANQSAAWPTS
jgi:hypothetical protein